MRPVREGLGLGLFIVSLVAFAVWLGPWVYDLIVALPALGKIAIGALILSINVYPGRRR